MFQFLRLSTKFLAVLRYRLNPLRPSNKRFPVCVGNQLIVSYNITGKLFVSRFANFEGILGFSVLSIILADLLGNRCSFQRVQKVMVCNLWLVDFDPFIFQDSCLWASCFGQFSTCLLWFWSFLRNVFLGLTCNTKAKSTSFPRQKYHRNFLCYLNEW